MVLVRFEVGAGVPIFFWLISMNIQNILKRVEEIVQPILDNIGFELIERELVQDSGRLILRLYINKIDKDGKVTIDDCARVSHEVEDVIEVSEVIDARYSLEVSSPGINRPIRRRKDFEKYLGSTIKLKTLTPIDGRSNYKGVLESIQGDDIVIIVDGVMFRIPFEALAKARLEEDQISSRH